MRKIPSKERPAREQQDKGKEMLGKGSFRKWLTYL